MIWLQAENPLCFRKNPSPLFLKEISKKQGWQHCPALGKRFCWGHWACGRGQLPALPLTAVWFRASPFPSLRPEFLPGDHTACLTEALLRRREREEVKSLWHLCRKAKICKKKKKTTPKQKSPWGISFFLSSIHLISCFYVSVYWSDRKVA